MVRAAPSVITAGENARLTCQVPRTNDFFMGSSTILRCHPRESGDPVLPGCRVSTMGPRLRGDDGTECCARLASTFRWPDGSPATAAPAWPASRHDGRRDA